MTLSQRQLCIVLSIVMLLLFLASIAIGRDALPLFTALKDVVSGNDSVYAVIVSQIRLPRALIALFAGASLGLCGAAMQGLLRNPLASPGLIGSSSGAAVFAVFVLYIGSSVAAPWVLPVAGMFGALLATVLVYIPVSYTHLTLPTILLV